MSEFKINVPCNWRKRILTGGKFVEEDIIIENICSSGQDNLEKFLENNLETINTKASTIGDYQFYNKSNLKTVNMPNVTRIETKAFSGSGITSVVFDNDVSLVPLSFDFASELKTVRFNKRVSYLDSQTFTNCLKLETIIVPWSEGEVDYAPWGASNATVIYNNGEEALPSDDRTWILKGDSITSLINAQIPFTSNGREYKSMVTNTNPESGKYMLKYSTLPITDWYGDDYVLEDGTWASDTLSDMVINYSGITNEAFKRVTFADDTYKDNAIYFAWLQENYTQQGSSGDDSGDTNTFTFTIDGKTYTAIEGMDWETWCSNTEYNTDGYFVGYAFGISGVFLPDRTKGICDSDSWVQGEDTIDEYAYTLQWTE